MAALCRSMQASQLPFANLHHPELNSGVDSRDPKRSHGGRGEEDRGVYHPKFHTVPARPHNSLHPNPCASPKSPHHFIFPQNGSPPVLHSTTNSHHTLDSLRRLHHPPPLPPCSVSNQSFPGYRSPRTPTPHSACPGQRTPKTPETPISPRLGPLSSPPPSSPMTLAGVRATQSHVHYQHGSPLSTPPSHNCVSPHQRSRHPSASPSYISEQGGSSAAAGEAMGRRKSTSSSPHSPLPCGSPNLSPHFPKYKLEDILEQFKNSGSTNNHQFPFPTNTSLLTNQSSPALSQKNSPMPGPTGFGLNSSGPSNLRMGPSLNHHSSNQSRLPPTSSFPASSLLSAAAKANQITQGQASNVGSNPVSLASSLEAVKEPQQYTSKVTNSTLHNNHPPPSSTACPRPPHPSVLHHPAHSIAHSLASSLPPTGERGASHRKRQRRSPTVLSMIRDTQQLANGPRITPPEGESSSTVMNLSSPRCSSTSAVLNRSVVPLENHQLLPGQTPRLSAPRHTTHLVRPKGQNEALDFTTGSPLGLDAPTQPLSALLHLLSVQNAQNASALAEASGDTNKQMNKSTSSPGPHTKQSLCPTNNNNNTNLMVSQQQLTESSPQQRRSPIVQYSSSSVSHSNSPSNHTSSAHTFSQTPLQESSLLSTVPTNNSSNGASMSEDISHSYSSVSASTSPKPLDLSNHVLALLAASSTAPQAQGDPPFQTADVMSSRENHSAVSEEPMCLDPKVSLTKLTATTGPGAPVPSHVGEDASPQTPSAVGDPAPMPLAEAFPFMNQEQLLQLLSSGGLPSLLDPTVLASLPLGGLWLSGQNAQLPPSNTPQTLLNLSEQQSEQLLIQPQDVQNQDQQKQMNSNPLFPLLPLLSGAQGELPLNLLGLINPIPPPAAPTSASGQEGDFGLTEKPGLQALLMASLLLGQHQAPLLPLSGLGQVSLEVPLQQPQLDSLSLDKSSGLINPSALSGPGLLELSQGLLPIPAGSEGQLLLPASLPHPAAFLSLSPALLSAALSSAELHPPPHPQLGPAQQTQQIQHQTQADAGVDTLIPFPLQGKDNPILQQLLPALLNPAVLGDLSSLAGLQNFLGMGAGSILLPTVQTSALGMSLLQGPDGAINLLNNLQLSIATASEGERPVSLETESPDPQDDIPANQMTPEVVPSPAPVPTQAPGPEPTAAPQRAAGAKPVIDPYTSFMDTIYTSFLQVSAKEQEEGAHMGPSDPTSPFCALPPVSFPLETLSPSPSTPALPQASAPVSLSPRRACSLRNPDLSRVSLEAAAHSPAQGTPKPTEDGPVSLLQRKTMMVEGHMLPPIYLEEAKTDCTRPAAVCPYVETGERKGLVPQVGYLSPGDGCSGINEDTAGTMLPDEHESDAGGALGGARRGRKRKQTLQNVLEDFRDLDAVALDETKATSGLLKPERSVRGRRRRGTRSQRQ